MIHRYVDSPEEGLIPYVRQDGTDEFEGWVYQRIYGVPYAGGEPVQLSDPPANTRDVMPEVSPDGLSVLFLREYATIYRVDVGSPGVETNVAFVDGIFGVNARPRWRPDGQRIVYSQISLFPGPNGVVELRAVDPDGTNGVLLGTWDRVLFGALGDFGFSYDGSVVVYRDPSTGTLWTIEDDGTNATDTGNTIGSGGFAHFLTPGYVSDLVVYVDQVAREIRKCALDGSGDTLVETIGTNGHRMGRFALSRDDSTWFYTYDTNNVATPNGWFTGSLGLDSQIMAVPIDGSGEVATGVWTYMETAAGNLGNNLVDIPVAGANGRFYIAYNETSGSSTGGADIHDYHFGSFLPDGSDGRIEDEFDISGPEPAPAWDAPVARITMEDPIF